MGGVILDMDFFFSLFTSLSNFGLELRSVVLESPCPWVDKTKPYVLKKKSPLIIDNNLIMDKYHSVFISWFLGVTPGAWNGRSKSCPPLSTDDWQIWKWVLRKQQFKPTNERVHFKQSSNYCSPASRNSVIDTYVFESQQGRVYLCVLLRLPG